MYNELVKRLRAVAGGGREEKCDGCPYEEDYPCCVDCLERLHKQAADAIEKMSDAYDKLSRHMDDLAALMPRWIPVSESLPEKFENVLVANIRGKHYDIGKGWWNGSFFDRCAKGGYHSVTHWMPLPEPPEED